MFTLNCKGRLLVIDEPVVMGIINVTPDSFYAGSRGTGINEILQRAEQMLKEGAAILDIGGQSTRPGSERVSAEEELTRIIGPVENIRKEFPDSFISVDTFYGRVAKETVEAGASLINDVSAGMLDPDLLPEVARLGIPYVLMHMKGEPGSMQQNPAYENVTREVLDFLIKKKAALNSAGIQDVIIDPGFGFGKSVEHNFQLLRQLNVFTMLEAPLLLGISRKSTIYKTLGITADEALNGTTVLNTIGLMNGANILRVHDVKEAREAIQLVTSYMQ
jgi:dihydropteroate synthase